MYIHSSNRSSPRKQIAHVFRTNRSHTLMLSSRNVEVLPFPLPFQPLIQPFRTINF